MTEKTYFCWKDVQENKQAQVVHIEERCIFNKRILLRRRKASYFFP